jgi:fucose 4-O-acetylase-like acetyltransferase
MINNTKFYYGGLDILRHIFALSVIFQHMASVNRFTVTEIQFVKDVVFYIDGAVAGFFLISGFCFHKDVPFKLFVRKKFKRIMFPFFIFSFLYAIIMTLLDKYTLVAGLKDILLFRGIGPQMYFLPYLFLVSLAYFGYYKILNRLKVKSELIFLIVLFSIFVLISLFMQTDSPTGQGGAKLVFYFVCFGIGILIRLFSRIHTLFIILISFGLGFYDFRYFHISGVVIVSMFAIFVSRYFCFLQRGISGSGGVYLLHQPITSNAISMILLATGISGYCNLFLSWGLTYVFCLLTTLLLIHYFPLKKWILLE